MRNSWKASITGLAMAAALVGLPAQSRAAGCGDLNNDGTTNIVDAILMSQCLAFGGTCPSVSPGPLCGTGNLIDCGDVFGDGDVSFSGLTADLAALVQNLAGLATLFDACEGPGPVISCPGGTVTLPSQTISSSQTWPSRAWSSSAALSSSRPRRATRPPSSPSSPARPSRASRARPIPPPSSF